MNLKKYIIIQEKLCHNTGRFKMFVFNKSVASYSSEDSQKMKSFKCDGLQEEFRHIRVDLETGKVVVFRSPVSAFPSGVEVYLHDDDKQEQTSIIDSNA